MSTSYQRLEVKQFPRKRPHVTPETRYWNKFAKPEESKHVGKIGAIEFCPKAPYDYAITCSTRVKIFGGDSGILKKTIARFSDVALSCSFRSDGKLLVAGGADGHVQVFDTASRVVLRSLLGHTSAVHAVKYCSSNTKVYSASDDKTVRSWDIPLEQSIAEMKGHTDYVRCLLESPASASTWLSGSYDHTVKCWDARANTKSVFSLDHGAPVEALVALPGGSIVISAGDSTCRVWDVTGGRLLHSFSNHQKLITALAIDKSSSRLLSASLDGHVKVYDVANYAITHSIKFPKPIVSMALAPDNGLLAVGFVDGTLMTRKRAPPPLPSAPYRKPRTGTRRFFNRGMRAEPAADDHVVAKVKKTKLRSHDVFMKQFQYRNALDAALSTGRAVMAVSVIEELVERGGLGIALGGRDAPTLVPLLQFLTKQITNPAYASLLTDTTNLVIDIYGPVLGQSMAVDELFLKLRKQLRDEARFQKKCARLLGTLQLLGATWQQQQKPHLEDMENAEEEGDDEADDDEADAAVAAIPPPVEIETETAQVVPESAPVEAANGLSPEKKDRKDKRKNKASNKGSKKGSNKPDDTPPKKKKKKAKKSKK